MTTRLQRLRTPPRWRAGLRIGRVRDEATLAILSSPVMMDVLRRADEQLRAWGVVSMPMDRVKQPFDYPPRSLVRCRLGACVPAEASRPQRAGFAHAARTGRQ